MPRVHGGGAPVRDGGGRVQERARPAAIGDLEPNTDYYTFCVAENLRQVAMNNTLQSTELHVVTLVGRRAAAR